MSAQERDSSDEIQQLRNELEMVIEERQTLIMRDMREVMAVGVQQRDMREVMRDMRNNGPSESNSAAAL